MDSLDTLYTISRLAQSANVHVETIRYYERTGLLKQPRKPLRGWRQYDRFALQQVRFIKRCQKLGFTLLEIKELLSLRTSKSPGVCSRVAKKASAKIFEINQRIADLEAMRDGIETLLGACPTQEAQPSCPLLVALDVEVQETTKL